MAKGPHDITQELHESALGALARIECEFGQLHIATTKTHYCNIFNGLRFSEGKLSFSLNTKSREDFSATPVCTVLPKSFCEEIRVLLIALLESGKVRIEDIWITTYAHAVYYLEVTLGEQDGMRSVLSVNLPTQNMSVKYNRELVEDAVQELLEQMSDINRSVPPSFLGALVSMGIWLFAVLSGMPVVQTSTTYFYRDVVFDLGIDCIDLPSVLVRVAGSSGGFELMSKKITSCLRVHFRKED